MDANFGNKGGFILTVIQKYFFGSRSTFFFFFLSIAVVYAALCVLHIREKT